MRNSLTPCADFLIPIYDDWFFNNTLDVRISEFWDIGRLILGGTSKLESFGNFPNSSIFVEADGEIEGLDVLRICDGGIYKAGMTVFNNDFMEIIDVSDLHCRRLSGTIPLPQGCRSCPEHNTCAGGYLPHRYSQECKFDNPSVWCADLLKLFTHIRQRMEVSIDETRVHRQRLQDESLEGCSVL